MPFALMPRPKKALTLQAEPPRRQRNIVEADAEALIESFGDGAYEVARTRGREERGATVIDGNRPRGHWHKVRRAIARRTGKEIGRDTASRYQDI